MNAKQLEDMTNISGGFRGGVREVQMHPPLVVSNSFFHTWLNESIITISYSYLAAVNQQWHAVIKNLTVTHSRFSCLLISRHLTKPRVTLRYSG